MTRRRDAALLILTYIFNIIDCALTMYFSKTDAIFVEFNPFGRALIESGLAEIYKVLIVGLLLYLLWVLRENRIAYVAIRICFYTTAALIMLWLIVLLLK